MTGKDPKDMTASELLRWAAENDKLRMRCDMCMKFYMMDSCGGHDCNDWLIDLADKIDAEIEEARIRYFLENLDTRIEKYGYPSRIERELFDEWINRCFIQRPLDEAGEPVQFGDCNIDWNDTAECRHPGVQWNATAVDCDGMLLATAFGRIIAVAETDENGRVKRRAPEVLLADGLPAKVGETVYRVDTGKGFEIARIAPMCPGDDMSKTLVLWGDDNEWRAAIDHTHTPPVLAADGLPLREGETVWLTDEGARHAGGSDTMAEAGPYALCGIGANDRLTVKALPSRFYPNRVDLTEEGAWCPASWLTHTPPDSQERIDGDAQKSTLEYWGCRDASCECCPAETDGKTPRGRFDARNCQQAQMLDLLRRQRELDACKGGE
ncbi:hypothetical protein N1614_04290 [Adlercreutzia muris]|uniref:hypothetical protein n=1 Tax=Adlercreutzia muris TaxID=1796610 RepID=UPI0021D57D96|nr:hypothetical protein [Adlercreutzia muris]MCU7584567.1 hypothetical protein [Adlercreutzia muris]